MSTLNVLLAATLTVTDTTGGGSALKVTTNLGNPTLAATTQFYSDSFQVGVAPTVVSLPAPTVYVVYVKNQSNANNMMVTFTPTGGSAETLVLVPGGIFMYFQPAETGGGITALSLTAASTTSPAEILLAA